MYSDAAPTFAKMHAALSAAIDPDGLEPAGPASSAEQEGEDWNSSGEDLQDSPDSSSSSIPGNANPSEGCNWDVLG